MQKENLKKNGSKAVNGKAKNLTGPTQAERLFDGRFQVGIGVYDGISTLLAEKWKFDFAWVSSFCASAAMGLPDVGIIGPEDILNIVHCVRRCADLPILTDLDSGYGDPVKVFHVIEAMARAGVACAAIEDNPTSKRCSLYDGYERTLASIDEHVSRIRAACEGVKAARTDCRIVARTEALVAGMGMEEALKRAHAYADAGADGVFVQSLDATGNEILEFGRRWKRATPYFIAPTRLPHITKAEFAKNGISHAIFANQGLRAAHGAIDRTFGTLAQSDSADSVTSSISSVATVASLVGAQKVTELETLFGGDNGKAASAKGKMPKAILPKTRRNGGK